MGLGLCDVRNHDRWDHRPELLLRSAAIEQVGVGEADTSFADCLYPTGFLLPEYAIQLNRNRYTRGHHTTCIFPKWIFLEGRFRQASRTSRQAVERSGANMRTYFKFALGFLVLLAS